MMAFLIDAATSWEAGIYQIETTDPVLGGTPNASTGAGMSNIPHQQLAKRTQWLKDRAGGYADADTISAGVTLTAADAGKAYVYAGTTAITVTLPAISGVLRGACFEVINTGTANVTVQRAGSDQIDAGPSAVNSLVIPPNQSLRLVRANGSTLWHPVGITAAALSFSLASSLGASGWQRLPSGLIMQWGTATFPNSGSTAGTVNITFPIAFPAACAFVTGSTELTANSTQGGWPSVSVDSHTLTGARLIAETYESAALTFNRTVPGRWFALGY